MSKLKRSQGAEYVKTLAVYSHSVTNERRVLHWTPTKSIYVSDDGEWREIWQLPRSEAVALCEATNVRFRDAVSM